MEISTLRNDKWLFERIAQSDAEAFGVFYEAYAVKLALYVSRFLGSDLWAEEIVQDSFEKLWSIRDTIGDVEYPAGFVYRMVANRTKDHLKRRGHETKLQQHLVNLLEHTNTNSTQDLLDYQRGEKLFHQAVQELPAQRAQIFKMRHEQGMSYDDIAAALGLSRNTVRNHLNLALQNIRAYLLEHGDITGMIVLLLFFK